MNHDAAAQLLDAYLDEELDPGTTLSVEQHLRECEACTDWLEARRALVMRVRTSGLRYTAPPDLERRLQVFRPARAHRVIWMPPWLPALAASLVLLASGFLLGRTMLVGSDLDAQFVAAHVRALLDAHTVDVVSSDHHTVKPWFGGRVSFAPPVPELGTSEDALLGGRLDYLEHQRLAVLVYRHGKHTVSVFVFPHGAFRAALRARASSDGYNVMARAAGNFGVVFVSDASADELNEFARRWLEAAHAP
ncbi:MAG TPA: zf-HC2 domain-containing protein [Steroidobacteraceae bacterium]|nr:zf-HC2 domain-containing protein [Steroidobacteraceae bacterium]